MNGVCVSPGATALTLTPSLAHSMAAALVSASSAPFAAAYSPIVGTPTEALREVTLTIDPRRRSSILRPASRSMRNDPMKFVSSTRLMSASDVSRIGLTQSMAALLTRMSAPPHRSARSMAFVAVASLDTSPAKNCARSGPKLATSFSPGPFRRATMTTLAPSLTNRRTVASPMPLVPPVTTAILPASRPLTGLGRGARDTRTRRSPTHRTWRRRLDTGDDLHPHLARDCVVAVRVDGSAQPDLDRSRWLDQPFLHRVVKGSAVRVRLAEILLRRVAVGIELDEADLAMHLRERTQLRQSDRMVPSEVDRDDPSLDNLEKAGGDPAVRLLHIARDHGQIAVVADRQTVEDGNTAAAVIWAHQRRGAADVLRAEPSADAIRSTGVERDAYDGHVDALEAARHMGKPRVGPDAGESRR